MPLHQNASNSRRKDASSNYDVFLSFRGPDTRSTFVSYLYRDLKSAGIDVFKDDDELSFGGVIAEELPVAIDSSRIYIPIFSNTYASSKWCLLELANMMEAASSKGKKTIIPIFYRVTVDDVKLKTDLYLKDLKAHRAKETKERVDEWEKALKWVTQFRGWSVDGSKGDAEFCEEIVKHVSSKLKIRHRLVAEPLFGQDYQKQRLIELLEMESLDKVVVIGIHGMGGIGKTTIAKVVYNKLYDDFDHCSFLSDVRQTLSENKIKGCLEMQKTLLSNVGYGSGDNIDDSDDAIRAIADRCKGKRVLIVLDDVNKEKQINSILGESTSFGGGSRIIITTRDARTLPAMSKWPNVKSYEMEELKMEDALELFNWHAFGQLSSPVEYTDLCDTVVPHLTGRVPLCLEVIGSLLHNKDQPKWLRIIHKLEKIPAEEIQEKLMISYEDLSDGAKEIFLDISCIFLNRYWVDIRNAVYMWEACGYFPDDGIEELVSMSLIKIEESTGFETDEKIKRFWMHDKIKDLGREIVRREGLKDKDQCSRFWHTEESLDMLRRRKKETNNIKAVSVLLISEESHLLLDSLRNLDNLRFLEVIGEEGFQLEGILEHVSSNLRWLSCRVAMAPEIKLANKIYLNKLVILVLSHSDITEDWDGWKKIQGLCSLRVLDLSWCLRLRRTPDLTQFTSLERLILYACDELVEIDRSIGNLKALKFLDLRRCKSLKGLPEEIGCLVHLADVFTTGGGIEYLPESIGGLKSLSRLELFSIVNISRIPESIGQMVKLETFFLRQKKGCHLVICNIPKEVGYLTSLVTLRLENIGIASLPDSVGGLINLKLLSLEHCLKLKSLPDSLGRLVKLEELLLSYCGQLISLPDSIGKMGLLKEIDVSHCIKLKKLPRFTATQKQLQVIKAGYTALEGVPTEIKVLSGLRHLYFQCSRICGLPSIAHLCHLEELVLEGCNVIKQFLELPTSLIRLHIKPEFQSSFPDLSNLTNLEKLDLKSSKRQFKVDHIFLLSRWELGFRYDLYSERLTHRQSLNIEWIGRLSKLTELDLRCWRLSLQSPPLLLLPYGLTKLNLSVLKGMASLDLPPLNSLTELTVVQCNDLVEIPGLQKLFSLQWLKIIKCNALEKLDDLSELNRLEHLGVGECKKLTVIIGMHQLQSIRTIDIYACHSLGRFVGSSRFKNVVNGFRDLRRVRIKYCNMLSDLSGLEVVFKYLKELHVQGCRSLKCLLDLSALRHLTTLKITNCRKLQKIQGLKGLEQFFELEVSDCRSLERLNIVNCNMLKKIQGLGELTSLKTLRISGCGSINTLSFDPWMIQKLKKAHIENCKNLKDIIGLDNLQLSPECLLIYRCQLLGRRLLDGLKMQHDTAEHPVTVSKVELLQNEDDSDYYLGDLFESEHEGSQRERDAFWCLPIGSLLSNVWHSSFH